MLIRLTTPAPLPTDMNIGLHSPKPVVAGATIAIILCGSALLNSHTAAISLQAIRAVIAMLLQGLHQLEPAILDKLLWPSVPVLTSVHLQEEVTRRGRDALSGCVVASLMPLRR